MRRRQNHALSQSTTPPLQRRRRRCGLKENFPGRWWIQKHYKNQKKKPRPPPKSFLCGSPCFSAKKSSALGQGGVWLLFPRICDFRDWCRSDMFWCEADASSLWQAVATANNHPKTNYHSWFLTPQSKLQKNEFSCRKQALSHRKVHFPAEKCTFLHKNALSCKKNAVFEGYIAGNCRKLQEGFRAQESRTLANFHLPKKQKSAFCQAHIRTSTCWQKCCTMVRKIAT